jgi:hypothetical protein
MPLCRVCVRVHTHTHHSCVRRLSPCSPHPSHLLRRPFTLQFISYEKYKILLGEWAGPEHSIAVGLGSGSLAGITAVCATYPLDTMRARMAMQSEGLSKTNYRGLFDALLTVGRTEGAVALYRGLAATVAGAAPYTGLKFAGYEALKRLW